MGFIKRSQKRRFEFKHFGVSHSVDHEEPGYERTEVFNPGAQKTEIRYIQKFDAIDGIVIGAEWYDRTDKKDGRRSVGYLLTMDVDEEVILLDFPFGRSAYRTLMRHGPNVDWSKRVKFSAWKTKTKQDKDANAMCIWQAGPDGAEVVIRSAHTLENPNGCPEAIKNPITGKWDFSQAEIWLKQQFDKLCVPKIKAAGEKHQPAQPAAKAAVAAATAATGDPNDPYGDYSPADDFPPEDYDDGGVPF